MQINPLFERLTALCGFDQDWPNAAAFEGHKYEQNTLFSEKMWYSNRTETSKVSQVDLNFRILLKSKADYFHFTADLRAN